MSMLYAMIYCLRLQEDLAGHPILYLLEAASSCLNHI